VCTSFNLVLHVLIHTYNIMFTLSVVSTF